jgi:hypothetical protein
MERVLVVGLWAMDTHRLNGKIIAFILFQVGESHQKRDAIERNVRSNLLELR